MLGGVVYKHEREMELFHEALADYFLVDLGFRVVLLHGIMGRKKMIIFAEGLIDFLQIQCWVRSWDLFLYIMVFEIALIAVPLFSTVHFFLLLLLRREECSDLNLCGWTMMGAQTL